MKCNTAVGFLLASVALWELATKPVIQSGVGRKAGGALSLLAALTLAQDLFNWDLGIDQLLVADQFTDPETAKPGRMSSATAQGLLVMGGALLFSGRSGRKLNMTGQILAILGLLIGLTGIMGYLFGLEALYEFFPYSSMAIHTSLMLVLLSLGILCLEPGRGIMAVITSGSLGGVMARKAIPFALALPVFVGLLCIAGQRSGLFDPEFGTALGVVLNVLMLGAALWYGASALNRLHRQTLQDQRSFIELELRSRELAESEARIRNIIEACADAIVVVDFSGAVRFANGAAEELFQKKVEDWMGTQAGLAGWVSSSGSGELPIERPDGSIRYAEVRVAQTFWGEESVMLATLRDVTEHREANEKLRRSEERFQLAVSGTNAGLWDWCPGSDKVYYAARFRKLLGYSEEEFPNVLESINRVTHPDDAERLLEALKDYLEAPSHYRFEAEFRMRNKAGEYRWFQMCGRGLWSENGVPYRMLGWVLDIHRRKEAEMEVVELNAHLEDRVAERTAELEALNRELETFAYSVSHDLRTPLRGISGFSQILADRYSDELDETGKNYLDRIGAGVDRMGRLIDDLLKLSQVGRRGLKWSQVDVSAMSKAILDELKEIEPNRQVQVDIEPEIILRGDEALLRVLMENLLGNAWKFTVGREMARIEVGSLTDAHQKRVYFVRDNGAGFDMRFADKLFGPFQRLHQESEFPGTGIGLATVQRIVNKHGGKVWAEGVPDEGATIFFQF